MFIYFFTPNRYQPCIMYSCIPIQYVNYCFRNSEINKWDDVILIIIHRKASDEKSKDDSERGQFNKPVANLETSSLL